MGEPALDLVGHPSPAPPNHEKDVTSRSPYGHWLLIVCISDCIPFSNLKEAIAQQKPCVETLSPEHAMEKGHELIEMVATDNTNSEKIR